MICFIIRIIFLKVNTNYVCEYIIYFLNIVILILVFKYNILITKHNTHHHGGYSILDKHIKNSYTLHVDAITMLLRLYSSYV